MVRRTAKVVPNRGNNMIDLNLNINRTVENTVDTINSFAKKDRMARTPPRTRTFSLPDIDYEKSNQPEKKKWKFFQRKYPTKRSITTTSKRLSKHWQKTSGYSSTYLLIHTNQKRNSAKSVVGCQCSQKCFVRNNSVLNRFAIIYETKN